MASPFKVFRKHQKAWLAVLTIMAMFSFVFLGMVGQLMGPQQRQNPVVVRTAKYGKLTHNDIAMMRQEHNLFVQIISRILAMAMGETQEAAMGRVQATFGTSTDKDVVDNWLKLQRAEEIGIHISDQIVNEFLQGIAGGKVGSEQIAQIIGQQNLSEVQFFDLVREELRANEVLRLFEASLQGVTPAQRWDYFCQLRKQATVEVIPIEVEQFVDQVPAPSEEELTAFFEKYKDKLPNPNSPEPGFRIPHTIDVQYFKAELAKFSDPTKVSDEEIQAAYEKNKAAYDRFEKAQSEVDKKAEGEKEKTAAPDEKENAPAEKPAEQPKEQSAPEKAKPADQSVPGQEKTPAEGAKKEDARKSSLVDRAHFSLVSNTEQADTPAAAAPAPEKPAADKPATSPPVQPQTPGAEKPAANQPAEPEKAEQAKPVLSDKTKELIRSQIAAKVAGEKISAALHKLEQTMDENGKKWRKYEAAKIHQQANAPTPPSLDFEELAKQNGLTAGHTGMVSSWEAGKFDINSSYIVQGQGVSPFTAVAFKSLATYRPELAQDLQGNGYLFWKVSDAPESEPSLKDEKVREGAIHAWKMIRARELARKQAESLADTANKSGATLKGAFADIPEDKVITPPSFSMLTEGTVPRGSSLAPPRLSAVEGVPLAGMDFMRAVFNLELNQAGVAMNAPQTVVYVVQLIKYTPPQDALWGIFLAEDFSRYALVAIEAMQADQRAWLESLKTSAGLKWEQAPQEVRGGPMPGPELPDD
jgi:hypothetical protein